MTLEQFTETGQGKELHVTVESLANEFQIGREGRELMFSRVSHYLMAKDGEIAQKNAYIDAADQTMARYLDERTALVDEINRLRAGIQKEIDYQKQWESIFGKDSTKDLEALLGDAPREEKRENKPTDTQRLRVCIGAIRTAAMSLREGLGSESVAEYLEGAIKHVKGEALVPSPAPVVEGPKLDENGLLPCAHCGGKAYHLITTRTDNWIGCDVCGASSAHFREANRAFAAWNKRALTPNDGGNDNG